MLELLYNFLSWRPAQHGLRSASEFASVKMQIDKLYFKKGLRKFS